MINVHLSTQLWNAMPILKELLGTCWRLMNKVLIFPPNVFFVNEELRVIFYLCESKTFFYEF